MVNLVKGKTFFELLLIFSFKKSKKTFLPGADSKNLTIFSFSLFLGNSKKNYEALLCQVKKQHFKVKFWNWVPITTCWVPIVFLKNHSTLQAMWCPCKAQRIYNIQFFSGPQYAPLKADEWKDIQQYLYLTCGKKDHTGGSEILKACSMYIAEPEMEPEIEPEKKFEGVSSSGSTQKDFFLNRKNTSTMQSTTKSHL